MMHIITKVTLAAAAPAAMAVGLGYLAMTAHRPEAAQLLYAQAATTAGIGILAGIVMWASHYVLEALRAAQANKREADEAKVRMLMMADSGRGGIVDSIFGPKEM